MPRMCLYHMDIRMIFQPPAFVRRQAMNVGRLYGIQHIQTNDGQVGGAARSCWHMRTPGFRVTGHNSTCNRMARAGRKQSIMRATFARANLLVEILVGGVEFGGAVEFGLGGAGVAVAAQQAAKGKMGACGVGGETDRHVKIGGGAGRVALAGAK